MESRAHLIIHSGPDAGRELRILDPAGLRVGRSSKNDFVLQDPKSSRYHCRFVHKLGDGLFVSDLGSANQTLVNGQPVREVRLSVGDVVTLGDTLIKVIDVSAPPSSPTSAAAVDLGFDQPPTPAPARSRGGNRSRLVVALVVVVLLALAAWLPRLLRHVAAPAAATTPLPAASGPLEIEYEKVLADTTRIFRYHLQLRPDRRLKVKIDDTDTTHLIEEGQVKEALVADLAQAIRDSGFLALEASYEGIQPASFEQVDLTVTIGSETKRCRVLNRAEPEAFQAVREKLENFAQVELGLWAVQYPPDKLVEMAHLAYLDGKKLFDQRDVQHANLAHAIRRLKDGDFYLKTIEPKPPFHPDLLASLAAYRAELDRRYVDQNFLANQAVRTKDWDRAAQELRLLCDILEDRADPRYEEARRQLLEVERRMNVQKK